MIKIYQHFDKTSGGRASRQAGREAGRQAGERAVRQAGKQGGRQEGGQAGWLAAGRAGGVVFRLYRLKYNTKIEEKTRSLTHQPSGCMMRGTWVFLSMTVHVITDVLENGDSPKSWI